jgi:hypothetical protein
MHCYDETYVDLNSCLSCLRRRVFNDRSAALNNRIRNDTENTLATLMINSTRRT